MHNLNIKDSFDIGGGDVGVQVFRISIRPQRSIETIASFDQWSGTIENH